MDENGSTGATALLVIDMQCSWSKGVAAAVLGVPHRNEEVVAALVEAIPASRAAGAKVIYTRHGYDPAYVDAGRLTTVPLYRPLFEGGGLIRGTEDFELLDDLAAQEGDIVIDKTRFDSFIDTNLEQILRNLGVRRLLVAGCMTNMCVESTVRTASQRDFEVTVLSDCTTARTRERHERGLAAIEDGLFAELMPWRRSPIGSSE
jgi:nicotinamidase-related amidase